MGIRSSPTIICTRVERASPGMTRRHAKGWATAEGALGRVCLDGLRCSCPDHLQELPIRRAPMRLPDAAYRCRLPMPLTDAAYRCRLQGRLSASLQPGATRNVAPASARPLMFATVRSRMAGTDAAYKTGREGGPGKAGWSEGYLLYFPDRTFVLFWACHARPKRVGTPWCWTSAVSLSSRIVSLTALRMIVGME